jgi:hypothetical protein
MLKRVATPLVAGAAAVIAIGLGAGPALAATTLTVKITHGGLFTATASRTVLKDGSVSVVCASTAKTPASKAIGKIRNTTDKGTSPVKVGTTTKLSFNHCNGPLGKVTTKVESRPYAVKVDSKTNSKGQTAGMITGVKVHVSQTGCSFNVTGSAPGYFTNSKHTLTMTSKPPVKPLNKAQLTISGVHGCFGVVKNGQHPTYTSTYKVTPGVQVHSS